MTIANILVTPCAIERSLREYKDDYLEEKVSRDLDVPHFDMIDQYTIL